MKQILKNFLNVARLDFRSNIYSYTVYTLKRILTQFFIIFIGNLALTRTMNTIKHT